MRIKFKSRREGPVPMEAVVTISTARGRNEEVIVHRSQIDERGIEVDYIGERGRPASGRTSAPKHVWASARLGSKITRSLRMIQ
jgi:hypothetical protein